MKKIFFMIPIIMLSSCVSKKKLEDAKAGGATTRPYEDKVYEIEDELRLALQA